MLALQFVAKERAHIFPKSAHFAKLQNIRHVIYSFRSCFGSRQITYVTCNSQNQQQGIPQTHFAGKAVKASQNVGCFPRLTLTFFCTYSKMLEIHVDTVCCPLRYKRRSREHVIKLYVGFGKGLNSFSLPFAVFHGCLNKQRIRFSFSFHALSPMVVPVCILRRFEWNPSR